MLSLDPLILTHVSNREVKKRKQTQMSKGQESVLNKAKNYIQKGKALTKLRKLMTRSKGLGY